MAVSETEVRNRLEEEAILLRIEASDNLDKAARLRAIPDKRSARTFERTAASLHQVVEVLDSEALVVEGKLAELSQ